MNPHTRWQLIQSIEVSAIREMEKQAGVRMRFPVTDDPKVYSLLTAPDGISTVGIPRLRTPAAREYLRRIKPENFSQLVRVIAFCSGSFCSKEDNQKRVKVSGQNLFCMGEEVMAYAMRHGIAEEEALQITEFVRKGYGTRKDKTDWLKQFPLPEDFFEACSEIWYLPKRESAVASAARSYHLYWFKVHYPQMFYPIMLESNRIMGWDIAEKSDIELLELLSALKQLDVPYDCMDYIRLVLESRAGGYDTPIPLD